MSGRQAYHKLGRKELLLLLDTAWVAIERNSRRFLLLLSNKHRETIRVVRRGRVL
jgi:hypothetical protein